MPRTGRVKKKLPDPDPIYANRLVTRLINRIMQRGKKQLAQRLVYSAFDKIKKQGQDPVKIFETAVSNVSPRQEIRPRRVGGASYQVPVDVRGERRTSLAIRWLVLYANKRSNKEYKSYDAKLAAELIDAAAGQGEAMKKRDNIHKIAEANKAFSHFRW